MEPETERIANELLKKIQDYDYVSFAEAQRIEGFTGGDILIHLPGYPNLVLWAGLTEAGADAFESLHDRIMPNGCESLVYLIDGAMLPLPIARQIRHYKEPHWLPITLSLRSGKWARHGTG